MYTYIYISIYKKYFIIVEPVFKGQYDPMTPSDQETFSQNNKEILTGLEVNMQLCCPINIPITRGNKTVYSLKMDQSIFPILYFVYLHV